MHIDRQTIESLKKIKKMLQQMNEKGQLVFEVPNSRYNAYLNFYTAIKYSSESCLAVYYKDVQIIGLDWQNIKDNIIVKNLVSDIYFLFSNNIELSKKSYSKNENNIKNNLQNEFLFGKLGITMYNTKVG